MHKKKPMNSSCQPSSKKLSFLHLGVILGTAMGLPAMIIGGKLSTQFGSGTALISICIGNLILWLIGLGIISMSGKEGIIENVESYLGKFSSKIASLLIVGAFLVWYAIQLEGASEVFDFFIQGHKNIGNNFNIRLTTTFGLICTIAGMGGLRLIRHICLISFPFLIAFQVYAIFQTRDIAHFAGTWGVSFSAVLAVIATWFPGAVNLATFFRHARSKPDAFLALSIMTVIHILFESFTVIANIDHPLAIFSESIFGSSFYVVAVVVFVFIAFLCIDTVNIYFGAAGLEGITHHTPTYKEYAIIGLFGTVIYIFFQHVLYIEFLRFAGTNFIANLGVVLVMGYLVRTFVNHRPRRAAKFWSSMCWFSGCAAALFAQIHAKDDPSYALWAGVSSSFISFLILIFMEEILWSIKNLRKNH